MISTRSIFLLTLICCFALALIVIDINAEPPEDVFAYAKTVVLKDEGINSVTGRIYSISCIDYSVVAWQEVEHNLTLLVRGESRTVRCELEIWKKANQPLSTGKMSVIVN
jgi:hypothetical protein